MFVGYLIYTRAGQRAEAAAGLRAVAEMQIVEAVYAPGDPRWRDTDCFSIEDGEALAVLSSRLAVADGKGVPGHASLVAIFSLSLVTAESGRMKYKGEIFAELPHDVFLRRLSRGNTGYEDFRARVPGLAGMLLERVDENACPRIPGATGGS